ncbi:MAG: hypothetical protein HYU28_05550 [Actinobacteria bacterium]|nr:hypothetical protein [Actinomycetota bacterium]
MFFYVSLVLVIVAAVTLVIGLLSSGLPLVIVSIASSFLAGVFLILTVMRDRPKAEPLAAPPPPAAAGEFPIADYDDLKVGEIVPLLPELDDDELESVRAHEEGGKARATILGRIDELLGEGESEEEEAEGEFPIADYDDLKVGEIVPLLPELDDDELDVVREREASGRARASILNKIDDLLGEAPPAPVKKPAAKKPAAAKPAAAKSFPIAGYDALSVTDVAKALKKLGSDELKQVRTYEKRKKSRKGVLDKIEAELSSR